MKANKRLKFHQILVDILGSNNVYFQPPPNIQMRYPAIVYTIERPNVTHADGYIYKKMDSYQVMLIGTNPESDISDKIQNLPMSRFERHYTAENLNHDVYNVFY